MENNQEQNIKTKLDFKDSKYATGRRKRSIAKVWLKKGSGKIFPADGETAKIHYKGTLEDGTEFDSSYEKDPLSVTVGSQGGVIEGWKRVIPLMRKGDKWKVTIPSKLGYGEQGSPPKIPANATLIFEMELIEIAKAQPTNNSLQQNNIQIIKRPSNYFETELSEPRTDWPTSS